jgi:membrane protease YdiL (CAAX protease family)
MNQSKSRTWKKIGVFYALTLLLTTPYWYLVSSGDSLTLLTGLMWSPALAAILTKWIFAESVRELGWRWAGDRYLRLAYLIPLLYLLPVYSAVWISGLGGLNATTYVQSVAKNYGLSTLPAPLACAAFVLIAVTAGFIAKAGRALGEEIGWRGFLVLELYKVIGFTGAGLVSGVMWAFWHYPIILYSNYNAGTPTWYALACFTVFIVAVGFIAAWLRLRSESVWPAVILHASHNMFLQMIFTPMTTNTGHTAYVIDEFGVGLVITAVAGAFIVWNRRGELELPVSDAQQPIAVTA